MSNFYENIKSIRISKKLTQAVMSEKLEITEVHYNRIENDKVDISLSKMNKLAEIFGMTLIEILQYGQGVESVKEDSEKVKGLENKVLLLENRVKELTEMYNNLKVSYKYVSDSRDSFYPHLFMYNYLVMIINEKTINSFVLQRDLQENNSEYYNSLNQIIDYLKGYYMKAKKSVMIILN